MADVMTHEQRSRCMAAIKSKGTKPEMEVRRFFVLERVALSCQQSQITRIAGHCTEKI